MATVPHADSSAGGVGAGVGCGGGGSCGAVVERPGSGVRAATLGMVTAAGGWDRVEVDGEEAGVGVAVAFTFSSFTFISDATAATQTKTTKVARN